MKMEDDMIINKEKMYNWEIYDVWNKWGKCLQKPTNQMEIDGGLFPDTV